MEWGTSIIGTLVGLICAQTCKNSWSSIGYANLAATFPTPSGEPDWDLIRSRRVVSKGPGSNAPLATFAAAALSGTARRL